MSVERKDKKIRIAALADIHAKEESKGEFNSLFQEISEKADILLICGDLTEQGLPNEAKILADELSNCKIPILGILGNHDYANKQQDKIKEIISSVTNFTFLEGRTYQFKDVGFTGAKGFGGGFDNHMVGPFGEEILKRFVYETINESLHLEEQLNSLKTKYKVVILHYSPIRQTVEGEPLEVFPFLGSSRLAEPLDHFNVSMAFHGHAHYGKPEGKTLKGVPIYNVCYPLLKKINPKQPYFLTEI